MSIIKTVEQELLKMINELGYDLEKVTLMVSGRKELGDYQINDAMQLAKKHGKNPREIATDIVTVLEKDNRFTNVNIAGPGFINLSLSEEFLVDSMNQINEDIYSNIDKVEPKKIMMDYGGANIAKTLHVGHIRSANIGEALKRLAKALGHEVIADVHFGDIGRQSGMVIYEIKERYPDLEFFNENYEGDYNTLELSITEADLEEIYPMASIKAKEDENVMEQVVTITKDLEEGHKGYSALWNKIKELSIKDISKVYDRLNTEFDLLEGEMDCYPYIPKMLEYFEKNNYLRESEGAKVIDVIREDDNSPMPPLIIIKSNGATVYGTRDLATIYSRQERFKPDEYWYVTDIRQSLYFEQVFRAAHKTKLVSNDTIFEFLGFGTMNGSDGKPFKTRDGGVMSLKELISLVKEETNKRINTDIVAEDKREETAEIIAISTLKYADLIPFRGTDYIFDISKFAELEGKTAPYLLYSTVRMKSLLEKSKELKQENFIKINNTDDREVLLTLLQLSTILNKSLETKSLNDIADYVYRLTSAYNKFYAGNRILTCEDKELQESWLVLTKVVYTTNNLLLDILGMKVPEKM